MSPVICGDPCGRGPVGVPGGAHLCHGRNGWYLLLYRVAMVERIIGRGHWVKNTGEVKDRVRVLLVFSGQFALNLELKCGLL